MLLIDSRTNNPNPIYIVTALKAYKAGDRTHRTMQAQAASLSDQDMQVAYGNKQGPGEYSTYLDNLRRRVSRVLTPETERVLQLVEGVNISRAETETFLHWGQLRSRCVGGKCEGGADQACENQRFSHIRNVVAGVSVVKLFSVNLGAISTSTAPFFASPPRRRRQRGGRSRYQTPLLGRAHRCHPT